MFIGKEVNKTSLEDFVEPFAFVDARAFSLCAGGEKIKQMKKRNEQKSEFCLHRWPKATNNSAFNIAAPAAPRIVLWLSTTKR